MKFLETASGQAATQAPRWPSPSGLFPKRSPSAGTASPAARIRRQGQDEAIARGGRRAQPETLFEPLAHFRI